MPEDAKNNTQMKRHRGQKKFSRHLRIADAQRTAERTMNRRRQNDRRVRIFVQQTNGRAEGVCAHLHPEGRVGRTHKQQELEWFVMVSPRLDPAGFQKHFQLLPLGQALKYRNIHPRLFCR